MSGLRSSRYLLEAPMVIRMVLAVRKHLQITNVITLDNFNFKNFLRNQSLGMSRLRSFRYLVEAPKGIRMALAVREHLQITNMTLLDNFGIKNCLKNSISGDVWAKVLQEPVGGSHADQGRKSGVHNIFSDPGGQAGSNGTPHLALASTQVIPQGEG